MIHYAHNFNMIRVWMHTTLRSLIYTGFALLAAGCSGDFDFNSNGTTGDSSKTGSVKYDLYYCKSISTSSADGMTVKSGIYGAHRESLAEATEIINLDGSGLIDSCAVDSAGNLYWTDRAAHGVFRSDPDGKQVRQIVSGLTIPLGLAIDETNKRIYWSDWIQNTTPKSGKIGYSDLDGKNPKTIITGLTSGGKLTIADGKLYVSDLFGGNILQSNLEGEGLKKIADANQPGQAAYDAQHNRLIWTDIADDKIRSTDLDTLSTSDVIVFADEFANPRALAIDPATRRMYFIKPVENTGLGPNPSSQLHSADLDGTHITMYRNLQNSLNAVQTLMTVK